MSDILKLYISIGSIVVLFVGGVSTFTTGHPVWSYILWGLAAIWFIVSFIYYWILKRQQKNGTGNWIISYEKQNKKLPPIPDYLIDIIIGYGKGHLINKDIQLRPMSGQFWNKLFPSQREELKQLVEWLGISWDDYFDKMKRMLPPSNQRQAKSRPFEQI